MLNIPYFLVFIIQFVSFIVFVVSYWTEGFPIHLLLFIVAVFYLLLNIYTFIDIKEICWLNYVLFVAFCIFLLMGIFVQEITVGIVVFHSIVSFFFGFFLFISSILYDVN